MRPHQVASYVAVVQYEIRVKGRLASRWSAWFDGLLVVAKDDGNTIIRGEVADQAALHGILERLRSIGVPLLSLTELPPDAPTTDGALPSNPEGN